MSESLLPPSLRWAGPALSAAYGCGVALHRAFSSPQWAPLPTIVIGNITVGGTGKTPLTIWLAERLALAGERPAVLMRGYKGQAGDEAREVQSALKRHAVPVILGADRLSSARLAHERGCTVALLDDGFQHWALNRDLDIVLIDATRPFGGERLIPEGRLREPLSGLSRAGAIVITRADAVSEAFLKDLHARLRRMAPNAAAAVSRHMPALLRELNRAGELPLERLSQGAIAAACGIGNPGAFLQTLQGLKANVVSFTELPDHVEYDAETLQRLVANARNKQASALIVTQKDAVKLEALAKGIDFPILALSVKLEFLSGQEQLWARAQSALRNARHFLK